MTNPIENTLCFQACLYDQMKPVTRKILHQCFMWFEACRREGKYKEVFPSIRTIARMAKCGITSVKKSLKELDTIFPGRVLTRSHKLGSRSNHYHLTDQAFEFLALLQGCHFVNQWKKVRESVLQGLAEDENFLAQKIIKRGELSTMKVSTSHLSKVSTIKSSSSTEASFERVRTVRRPQNLRESQENPVQESRGFGFLSSLPLSEKDKLFISESYATKDLRKAVDDFEWFTRKMGNSSYNPAAFIQNRAKQHLIKRIFGGSYGRNAH